MANGEAIPLCVDLDGTLVRSDLVVESILVLIRKNLLYVFLFPFWLLQGRAMFKKKVAERVDLQVETLPFSEVMLGRLREAKAAGRPLVLATGSNERPANAVAGHLGIFSSVLGSTSELSLTGVRKRDKLVELYGPEGFDYAGNSRVDFPIFEAARHSILVNAGERTRQAALRGEKEVEVLSDPGEPLWRSLLAAIRLHQWLKNVVVFVPLILSHNLVAPALIAQTLVAFVAFGFCASSVYLLNDLIDLPSDRRHHSKKKRPFASGMLPIQSGIILAPGLLAISFAISLQLSIEFAGVLAFYYLVTTMYTLRFKDSAPIDVLILAGLYTLRVIAGAVAIGVAPSFWLLAFSMFLFLSLALAKRYTGIAATQVADCDAVGERGYRMSDLELLSQFGIASAFASVMVLALYINSDTVRELYRQPEIIWLLCPLLLYIVSRIWLLTRRGDLHEDPVIFAMSDVRTYLAVVVGLALLWLAI